jgi:hypothetical protein
MEEEAIAEMLGNKKEMKKMQKEMQKIMGNKQGDEDQEDEEVDDDAQSIDSDIKLAAYDKQDEDL